MTSYSDSESDDEKAMAARAVLARHRALSTGGGIAPPTAMTAAPVIYIDGRHRKILTKLERESVIAFRTMIQTEKAQQRPIDSTTCVSLIHINV